MLHGKTTNPIYVNAMYNKIRANNKTIIFAHRESNYPLRSSWYSEPKMFGVKVLAIVGLG